MNWLAAVLLKVAHTINNAEANANMNGEEFNGLRVPMQRPHVVLSLTQHFNVVTQITAVVGVVITSPDIQNLPPFFKIMPHKAAGLWVCTAGSRQSSHCFVDQSSIFAFWQGENQDFHKICHEANCRDLQKTGRQ